MVTRSGFCSELPAACQLRMRVPKLVCENINYRGLRQSCKILERETATAHANFKGLGCAVADLCVWKFARLPQTSVALYCKLQVPCQFELQQKSRVTNQINSRWCHLKADWPDCTFSKSFTDKRLAIHNTANCKSLVSLHFTSWASWPIRSALDDDN